MQAEDVTCTKAYLNRLAEAKQQSDHPKFTSYVFDSLFFSLSLTLCVCACVSFLCGHLRIEGFSYMFHVLAGDHCVFDPSQVPGAE